MLAPPPTSVADMHHWLSMDTAPTLHTRHCTHHNKASLENHLTLLHSLQFGPQQRGGVLLHGSSLTHRPLSHTLNNSSPSSSTSNLVSSHTNLKTPTSSLKTPCISDVRPSSATPIHYKPYNTDSHTLSQLLHPHQNPNLATTPVLVHTSSPPKHLPKQTPSLVTLLHHKAPNKSSKTYTNVTLVSNACVHGSLTYSSNTNPSYKIPTHNATYAFSNLLIHASLPVKTKTPPYYNGHTSTNKTPYTSAYNASFPKTYASLILTHSYVCAMPSHHHPTTTTTTQHTPHLRRPLLSLTTHQTPLNSPCNSSSKATLSIPSHA